MKRLNYLYVLTLMMVSMLSIVVISCDKDEKTIDDTEEAIDDKGKDTNSKESLSPAAEKILSEIEGAYNGGIRLTYRTGYKGNYGNEPAYATEIKITKQRNGLYSAEVEWNEYNLYFYNVEFSEDDEGNVRLDADDCNSDSSTKDWWFVFTISPNFKTVLQLFCYGPITDTYRFEGTKPYSLITNNVNVNVIYDDYAYTVDFSTSLDREFSVKSIKYGIEIGYGSYNWQMYATSKGTKYSVTCCVFIDGAGSPYADLGFMYSSYIGLKDARNLNSDQRGLLSDILSLYRTNESAAKRSFQGRVFVEINGDRYFIDKF